jgi:DMSO/TMAO reductase YedYZ molybdopterin-dependent catalytic subunit
MTGKRLSISTISAFSLLTLLLGPDLCTGGAGQSELKEYKGIKLDSSHRYRDNSIAGPQKLDMQKYRLKVVFPDGKQREYTYSELLALPSETRVVTLDCVEGWSARSLWQGFTVSRLIPEEYRKRNTLVLKLFSADGYSTSMPLDYILDQNIMLAHHLNGVTLPVERGFPLQLVAESKWAYKWIKWVTRIEISTDMNFRGYWEERGYSNRGDLSGPIFENPPQR